VSWPLLFIFGVTLRFAGVTPRVRRLLDNCCWVHGCLDLQGRTSPRVCAHPLRKARDVKAQVNAVDRAKMASAEPRVLFGSVLARLPGVNAIPGHAIGDTPHHSLLLTGNSKNTVLVRTIRSETKSFSGEAAAASRRRKLDAQEPCLHAVHSARFARSVRGGVDGLILRIHVGHGALQNKAYRRRRRPKNRLPADSRASIRLGGVAGNRKLAARLGAAGNVSLLTFS
jgi:hypothetical protein